MIISGLILGGIVLFALLSVLTLVIFEPVFYGDFYKDAKREFALPGMSDGFVQQGFSYGKGAFITSGYMGKAGETSRIYVTKDGESRWVTVKDNKGDDYLGHAGGISVYGDFVYLCDSDEARQMLVLSLDEILDSEEGDAVTAKGAFPVHSNASFCHVEGDMLYVGEFYREQNYSTDASHHKTTPAGDKHHSLVFGYKLSASAPNGLEESEPVLAYSIVDLAQGMCMTASGKIVITTSWAIANSHHYVYKKPAVTAQSTFTLNGKDVPLWYLDTDALDKDIVAPPMSEEVVYVNGRVYTMNESASNKYIFGKLLRGTYIWSYPLD